MTGSAPDAFVRIAGEPDAGVRIDQYLADQLPGLSRTAAQKRIHNGQVWIDGELVTKPSQRVAADDKIELVASESTDSAGQPVAEAVPFDVLYEDRDIIVIDKPSGLVVHPGNGVKNRTLASGLLHRFPDMAEQFRHSVPQRPGIVHRLDRDTSGVMVVARTEQARQRLAAQFADRQVAKIYLACVHGIPPVAGTLDAPLERRVNDRKKFSSKSGRGRPAKTVFRRLATGDRHALVEVQPHTGRTHQIRVHLADAGYPIVGDPWYGRKQDDGTPLMLHAWSLSFSHPATGANLSFGTPVPETFRHSLRTFFHDDALAGIES